MKTALSKATAAASAPPTTAEQKDMQDRAVAIQLAEAQVIRAAGEVAIFTNNAFKFTKQSTHNIMDYDAADNRCFYWHWQWALLQADVSAYYGTTSAAH